MAMPRTAMVDLCLFGGTNGGPQSQRQPNRRSPMQDNVLCGKKKRHLIKQEHRRNEGTVERSSRVEHAGTEEVCDGSKKTFTPRR